MIYVFDDVELDTRLYVLRRAGQTTQLRPKVFQVLLHLLEHRDRVISKQELSEQLWPDQFISDATMESCIRLVRQAIGDSGRNQRLIRTRHGHGYQFVGTISIRPEANLGDAEGIAAPSDDPVRVTSTPKPDHDESAPKTLASHCPVCQHENREDAVFCVNCSAPLLQSCGYCGQDVRLPDVFCAACGQPVSELSLPDPGAGVTDSSKPADAPPSLAGAVQTGERKIVTILCCGLNTTNATGQRLELDALHDQMRVLYDLAQHEVQQYEGSIPYVAGDRFLALFGVPMAQEDHAQRAALAAIGLLQKVVEHRRIFSTPDREDVTLSIGLHTGPVAVGGIGENRDIASTLVGDTALLATSLQERAESGTIVCSATTARLIRETIHTEPAPSVSEADQAAPLRAYRILGRRHLQQASDVLLDRRSMRRFVGRRRELAILRALLDQVAVGRGQVIGIAGDPGIGKSRILHEFQRYVQKQQMTYLEGRCLSYSRGTPYRPVLDLLRQACGLTEADNPETVTTHVHHYIREVGTVREDDTAYLLHLLGVHKGTEGLLRLTPQALKAHTFSVLRQTSIRSSQRRPLVIAIEDLHWIDATSEEWLTSLVESLSGVPILLIGTYRPGYHPPWIDKSYATQLSLQPLTHRDSRRLVQELFSTMRVPEALIRRLLLQADGNPFFLEELAQIVLEHGPGSPITVVPDTIQAVLADRIDRLPSIDKRLLQIVSLFGKDVPLPLLAAVAELPEERLLQGLSRLQAAEFLYESRLFPTPVYTFKHMLTQEVAYHSLLYSTRQPYHERIARVLVEQFPETIEMQPEWLAHHYTEAGLSAEAVPYWQQAGQRAIGRSANVEAIRHLKKGLDILKTLPSTPERVQQELLLQLALGAPLSMIKGHTDPEVKQTYSRAYELCQHVGESPQLFSALVGLWRFYMSQAELKIAYELGQQCFVLAQQAQAAHLLQEAHMMLGASLFYLGELISAHTRLEQGVTLYNLEPDRSRKLSRSNDPGVLCLSLDAWTLWLLGYPDRALARSLEALTLAQTSDHAYNLGFALHFASTLHTWRREVQLVKEKSEAVIALSSEHGFVRWLGGGIIKRGWILAEQGNVEEGILQLRQGLATWQAMGGELGLPSILVKLAEACERGGYIEESLQVLDQAIAAVHRNAEHYYEAELYRLKGELQLRLDNPDAPAAERHFLYAIDIARRQHARSWELRAVMSLSRLWQMLGRAEEAHQLLSAIYGWFTEGFDTADLREAKALLATFA